MEAYINSFESFGTKDGPGIRFVLFLQGCPLKCLYCHNVDSWDINKRNYVYTPEEIIKEINKVKFFISGGVTVSGGEPMLQQDFLIDFFKLCKENNLHTAIDTSGIIFNEKAKAIYENVDLVLLDIKHIDKNKYEEITSAPLEPTLKTMEYLNHINKPVWIRYVLVPGYTDNESDIERLAKYLSKFKNVERVDILPFHQMALYKWEKVGIEYKLKNTPTPTKEDILKAENILKKYNLPIFK